MNIGAAIKFIRKELNITQDALALTSSLSQTSLSQIENGVKRPTSKTLKKLCTAMDIPEVVIYVIAMEENDIAPNRRGMYHAVYNSIKKLALQLAAQNDVQPAPRQVPASVFHTEPGFVAATPNKVPVPPPAPKPQPAAQQMPGRNLPPNLQQFLLAV